MKTRIIAGVVLLPLLLLVVLAAPKFCTAILFGLMAAIAAYELLVGTGTVKNARLCVYSAVSAFWCVLWCGLGISYGWLLLGVLLFWTALFAEVMFSGMKLSFDKVTVCLAAGLVLPMLLGAVVRIHAGEAGRFFVLIPFVLAFLSDTGAYFVGLAMGKHKLAPTISPKKTWEGAIGGTAFALLLLVPYAVKLLGMPAVPAFVCVFIGSVLGQIGDLLESKLKRWGGVKDSGNFFPGHGGVLDRLDSLMLACPAVLLMWYLFV